MARAWIGRQHSLSDMAIRKRAKANGWTRDPGALRSPVCESLVREGVRANLLAGVTPSEGRYRRYGGGARGRGVRSRRRDIDASELSGMGTTLTMAYHLDAQLCVVHVGDSRAYVYRDGELDQLTHDHTLVADMVRKGVLRPDQVAGQRLCNVITNVVGVR
jgi:hypothetical protein